MLPVQSGYAKEEWNSLANLAFVTGQTNKMISSKLPSAYMALIPPERLAEQWIPVDPELRSLDRFPAFLAARRHLMANVLNRLLGLPSYTGQASHRDVDEPPADDEVIAEDAVGLSPVPEAGAGQTADAEVEVHAAADGH